jgi:hypothetical protein
VSNGQRFAWITKDHFLMCEQTAGSHGVNSDAIHIGTARAVDALRGGIR